MSHSIRISKRHPRAILARAVLLAACLSSAVVQAEVSNELDCVIEPHMVIDLSSRVDGIVESMEVERGERIDKGQVLVRLESSVEEAAVAEAQVRADATAEILASNVSAEFAQRRNERIQELHDSQAVSTDQLDEIKTEYELSRLQRERATENQLIAKLALRQAREILNRHTLRSPIRGIVVQHYLAPGETVEEQPIMRLAQIDPLRVEVIVPVSAFGSIKVGQRAIMKPESPMDGEYAATVTVVDAVADASSGTFRVRLGLPNTDYGLPSGLRCRVQFLPMEEKPAEQTAQTPPAAPVPTAQDPRPLELIKTGAVPAESADKICRTIGPIPGASEADRITKMLDGQASQVRRREEALTRIESYLVLAAPQPTLADARTLTQRMNNAGVEDVSIFRQGPQEYRVSLGLFRNRGYAQARQTILEELGFDVELAPRETEQDPQIWLDVELLPQITTLDLGAVGDTVELTDLDASRCEIDVPAGQPSQTLAGTLNAGLN